MAMTECNSRLAEMLADIPVGERLEAIRNMVMPEIETIGYELAPELNARTVASIFIMACEVDAYFRRIQAAVTTELRA